MSYVHACADIRVKACVLLLALFLPSMASADIPDVAGYVIGNPGDPVIAVRPSGSPPAQGRIAALPKAALSNGNAFLINDSSAPNRLPVRFYIRKTAGYIDPLGGVPIDISSTTITTSLIARAIASAISGVGPALNIIANGSPTASGTEYPVYLSYNYAIDPNSTGNAVTIIADVANPYPGQMIWIPGAAQNDVQHVQWAINNVASGGTVLLKRSGLGDSPAFLPFMFGTAANVSLDRNVSIQGEVIARQPVSGFGSGGWSLMGTRISGGGPVMVGFQNSVTFAIRDIIFDGFYAQAIRVKSAQGSDEITGNQFINYVRGTTFDSTKAVGAFPVIAHGGQTQQEINALTGTLLVGNNFFGKPASPVDNFNNMMHFSNANLNLVIQGNEIEDAAFAGFAVWGNLGNSLISNNTINKSKSYVEGAAIIVGLMTPSFFSSYAYNGNVQVVNNEITISSANSSGIFIGDYPPSQYTIPIPSGIKALVSGNMVTMNGSQKHALACAGSCSNSIWLNNTVVGSVGTGIYLSKSVPSFVQPMNSDARVVNNRFDNIDMRGLTVSNNYVRCDAYTADNEGRNINVPSGTTCGQFILDEGVNNVFNQLLVTGVAANPSQLWPPNHNMVPVTISATTGYGCGSSSCRIVGVSSNEASSGVGDWQLTSAMTLLLRAERLGAGPGRVYTVAVECSDEKGVKATSTVAVTVPHDQRSK